MDMPKDFRQLDKSLRKQRIVDTAIKMFHRMGYRATTMDDVASELGITRSALYHYVSSKEGLLSAIYVQALDQFFNRAYEIDGADLSIRQKLNAFVKHNLNHIILENLAMFGIFHSEDTELPAKEANRIVEEKKKYTSLIEKIIKQGMAEGVFRHAAPRLQAAAILGMCNWTYKWYKPGRNGPFPEEIADHFIAFMEKGILADDSTAVQNKRKEETHRITNELMDNGERLKMLISELQTVFDD